MRAAGLTRTALRRAALALALAGALPAAHAQFDWLKALSPTKLDPRALFRSKAPPPPTGVEEPFYGDTLFYFYQGRYFSSLTSLMVSQQFERMPKHADEAEVLRGGLYLSYGMHREAGDIFARLIERNAPPQVRDRAWYFLAKIRWQRGLTDEAWDAIARIEKPLPPELEEDRVLLQANLLMARGDNAGAVALLDSVTKAKGAERKPVWLYARYNLGVALVRAGDVARGSALLDELGRTPVQSEELRSLRDRANVALGFAALQKDDSAQARTVLERVRLNGMLSNKALLGFGWAAASQKQINLALAPWSELAGRDSADAAVLEAKLAVPFAYAELGAYQQALAGYQDAIAVFDREGARLDESIAAIRAGQLMQGLLERNPGEEMGWFWNIGDLPELPYGTHLAPILAQHQFQEAFKNWRDLLFMARNLQQWRDSLAVLRDMLANRRQAFAQRLPAVREKERGIDLGAADSQRHALRAEIERVQRDTDVAAFADARERALQARIDSARAVIARHPDEPAVAAARDRLRRAAGALQWQQSRQFEARLWAAQKSLAELEAQFGDAQVRAARLTAAQRDEPGRMDAFATRIDALDARLQALVPRVAELSGRQQAALQDLVVAELEQQKQRLIAHGTQARFAIAALYDRANLAKGETRGAAQ